MVSGVNKPALGKTRKEGSLESGFPAALPDSDRGRWAEMTASQRAKAAQRLAAFQDWQSGTRDLDEAVAASGLSRSRFYRLAADWRAAPALAALGVFTGSGAARERLDPGAVNALQAVVNDVVILNEGASVSQLVRLMVEQAGVEPAKLPGAIRLRQIVEDERRRIAATGEAGNTIMFDCTAINLPRSDHRPHMLFALVDKGTRLIFGAAIGSAADARAGYARVAADAQERLSRHLADLPWSLRVSQIYFTAGEDLEEAEDLLWDLRDAGVHTAQLKRMPRRYGGYFRQVVGERIGRIAITPSRTEHGPAAPDNGDMTPWSEAEAAAAVAQAVEQHNARMMEHLPESSGRRMPDDLAKTLRVLISSL